MLDETTTQDASPELLEFIEDMGLTFEGFGFPRMQGRLYAALLVADPPEQSAEDLASTLQASRGSISSAARALEAAKLIRRVSKAGERKDYFRALENAWDTMMEMRISGTQILRELMERGALAVQDRGSQTRRNLEESVAFFRFWEESFGLLVKHWEAGHNDPEQIFQPLEDDNSSS